VPTKTGKWTVIVSKGYRLCLPRQGSRQGLLVKGNDCAYQDREVDSDYNVSKG
jgi:hypothetical protein